jgi:hypothetical protein
VGVKETHIVDQGAQLPDTRFPGSEALAKLSRVTLDDPSVVLELVKVGRADDNVVHLAVADRVADNVGVGAAPRGRARLVDQVRQLGVGEELLARDELSGEGG